MPDRKSKKEYAGMKVSGFLKWIHRAVMLVTFPLRRFWLILTVSTVLLAVLFAVPYFSGIQPSDMWDWYMAKMPYHEFVAAKDKVLFGAESDFNKLKRTVKEIVPADTAANTNAKASEDDGRKNKTKLVSWNVAEFRRARYTPQKTLPVIAKAEENFKVEKNTESTGDNFITEGFTKADEPQKDTMDLSVYYTKLRDADLIYPDEPEILEGRAEVVAPNSLYINERPVSLYGIYSHPRRHNMEMALQYLKSLTDGRKIRCAVVAYSQKTRTSEALCFANGVFINKILVQRKLANNLAIKQ